MNSPSFPEDKSALTTRLLNSESQEISRGSLWPPNPEGFYQFEPNQAQQLESFPLDTIKTLEILDSEQAFHISEIHLHATYPSGNFLHLRIS